MDKNNPDPIVAEVRAVREKHAAEFNGDLNEIFRDIQARQQESGRKYVKYPPRQAKPLRTSASDQ